MKKSEAQGYIVLLVIGLLIIGWIQSKIGNVGLGVIVVSLVGIGIFWRFNNKKKAQMEFERLVLYTLYEKSSPNEKKSINVELGRINPYKAELIRNLQIIQESIFLALTSKKRDVAESRIKTVLDCYEEIQKRTANLVSSDIFNNITNAVQNAENEFQTSLYINIASDYIEKTEKLKTIKSKEKYLNLAEDVINEGLINDRSQKDKLEAVKKTIKYKKDALGEAI